jgi:F1F0 ATPase subunit 2
MMYVAAASAGAGLGLAYFGMLWLTVRGLVKAPTWSVLATCGAAIRFVLLAAGLAMLCRGGVGALLGALGGFWLSRSLLLRRLGGGHDGR